MYNFLPEYISEISDNHIETKQQISFDIKCECKSRQFYLYKNRSDQTKNNSFYEHWRKYKVPILAYQSALDKENGKEYIYGKTLFGFRVGKFYMDDISQCDAVHVIKVRCAVCGREYILFDNLIHGYDAVVGNKSSDQIKYEFEFVLADCNKYEHPVGIAIKIYNDLSYDEFADDYGKDNDIKKYADAFTYIIVYAKNGDKLKKVFEEETA